MSLLLRLGIAESHIKPKNNGYLHFPILTNILPPVFTPKTCSQALRHRAALSSASPVAPPAEHQEPPTVELLRNVFRHNSQPPFRLDSARRRELQQMSNAPHDSRLEQQPPELRSMIRGFRCGDIRSGLAQALQDGLFVNTSVWANVSPRLFSAVLACLDPQKIELVLDAGHGVGLSLSGPADDSFRQLFGKSRTRRIYLFLFRIVQWMFAVRIAIGTLPAVSDWTLIMRLAGMTGDRNVARRIWSSTAMIQRGYGIDTRNSESYAEYMRSRFLTSPAYRSVNPLGTCVSILDIGFKANVKIKIAKRNLLAAARQRKAQCCLQAEPEPEPELHMRDALKSSEVAYGAEWFDGFFAAVQARGVVASEDLVCSAILAFASQGSLSMIRRLLALGWDIRIHTDNESGDVAIAGGRLLPQTHPLYPTTTLIDSVVHAFGSNSEIQTCVKLADFISQKYGIQLSPDVWSSMLFWTQVAASKHMTWEWTQAGFHRKAVNPDAIRMLWNTMRSDPYNVEPSFSDYDVMIRYLAAERDIVGAIALVNQAQETFWAPNETRFLDAGFEYSLSIQAGAKTDSQGYQYERASVLRSVMHKRIGSWIRHVASRVAAVSDTDQVIVRHIPTLLRNFEAFACFPIRYRTCNGTVSLQNSSCPQESRTRRQADLGVKRAVRDLPRNFTSKRWWQHLQLHKARYSEYQYPSAPYGPRRQALGRPVLRRAKGDRTTTYTYWYDGQGGYRPVRRKRSHSWGTIDLHYEKPTTVDSKGVSSGRRPQLSSPFMGILPQLRRPLNLKSLLLPGHEVQASRTTSGRNDLLSPKKQSGKTGFLRGLSPDMKDQEGWRWAIKEWPNVLDQGLRRMRRARKVRVFIDGRRASPDMLKRFPLKEDITVDRESGRHALYPRCTKEQEY